MRESVIDEYVWTTSAQRARTKTPQIVLGARGSGKTALLINLTMPAQLARLDAGKDDILRQVGLLCQMKVNEVTSFNGKGDIPINDRRWLFSAMLTTMWSVELLAAIDDLQAWTSRRGDEASWLRAIPGELAQVWGFPDHETSTSRQVSDSIRRTRAEIIRTLGTVEEHGFRQMVQQLRTVPLLSGGATALADAARILSAHPSLSEVCWTVLFDEVEFLSPWQQDACYAYISEPAARTSCKVATLPYAHSRALSSHPSVLVLGHDYEELPFALASDNDFGEVARGLWSARTGSTLSLDDVWPATPYEEVLSIALGRRVDLNELDELLIAEIPPSRQPSARKLKHADPSGFGDQFRRKYQEPFRFRLARRSQTRDRSQVPLYWGASQMLKACGGNPRNFLSLAKACWNLFWSHTDIRPLSAAEQYQALKNWAASHSGLCATLPHRGHDLKVLVDRLADRIATALYTSNTLKNEKLTVAIEDCDQEQAEAIAIGIAYGFLVPRLRMTDGRLEFPVGQVVMRLGYPVAVAKELPLRQGEVIRIRSLRQLELSWWNE